MTNISAVRSALEQSTSPGAKLILGLIDSNRLSRFKTSAYSPSKLLYENCKTPYPQIGKNISPIDQNNIPSLEELQEMCLADLQQHRDYYDENDIHFKPTSLIKDGSVDGEMDDIDYAADLIKRVGDVDADMEDQPHAVTFLSVGLDHLCNYAWQEPYNNLKTNPTVGMILPRHMFQYLTHSNEGTTTVVLFSGSLLWMVWPPTRHNLDIMKEVYNRFSVDFVAANHEALELLEGGIVFMQEKGEAVRLPPFCPMLMFPIQTSVTGSFSDFTVENYLNMIPKISLLNAFFDTEIDGEAKRSEFNATFLRYLEHLLNGSRPLGSKRIDTTHRLDLNEAGLLEQLLGSWDSSKQDIADMLGPADAKTLALIWTDFLVDAKGRECRICNWRCPNKAKLMRKHFEDKHWVQETVQKNVENDVENDVEMEVEEQEDASESVQRETFESYMRRRHGEAKKRS